GGNLTTGGGTLTLGGDVTGNAASATATIGGNLALGTSRTFTIADGAAASDVVVSAAISGAGFGLTKAGAGSLLLFGNNAYSGPTAAGSGYDQLGVAGTVNLGGSTLNASLGSGFAPAPGSSFTIVENDGADPDGTAVSAGPLTANGARRFRLGGQTFAGFSFPSDVTGVLVNVTIVQAQASGGFATVFPGDVQTPPNASTVNPSAPIAHNFW